MPRGRYFKCPCECEDFVCNNYQKPKYGETCYCKPIRYYRRPCKPHKKEWVPSRRPCSCRH